ncbi:hypothetical protein HOLleu_07959 [Holothuria leucospilota]|uniref:Uncharacterized protein n=1 Tax=Holothuria leucospilota TaxID=206669 RepID=A0A9Q1CHW5_HOLLE|nr:hypothetical protein HOLleu_07959 [Holothuria leucospilota]
MLAPVLETGIRKYLSNLSLGELSSHTLQEEEQERMSGTRTEHWKVSGQEGRKDLEWRQAESRERKRSYQC